MQNTLDLAIKQHECGTVDGHYAANNGKRYPAYMDNDSWKVFRQEMERHYSTAFSEFGAGAGGELKDTGPLPPKMASYGSSSRMIFELAKDIPHIHFEYKLRTEVGGTAHLDGFVETEEKQVFVEAKCRELYGSKTSRIETKYRELYRYIDEDASCNMCIRTADAGNRMAVTFSVDGTAVSVFDMKQMICHLLGIASACLRNPTHKTLSFIYLCYDPTSLAIADASRKQDIHDRYRQWRTEFASVDFAALFGTIMRYLKHERQIGCATDAEMAAMIARFQMTLCDQKDFVQTCTR